MKRLLFLFLLATVVQSVPLGISSGGASAVRIDLANTLSPVSPYIYGQFIEHLGRCIYGGIWAEMLEDRKFFYQVGADPDPWKVITPGDSSYEGSGIPYEVLSASPWMVIGETSSVRMVREGAFVGEHTPEIRLQGDGSATGIYQGRLGLVGGKEYVGRIAVSGSSGSAPVAVSLVWGAGPSDRATLTLPPLSEDYTTQPFSFTSGGSTENGRLEISGRGKGWFRVGTVSLMPADHVHGFRKDTLNLLKELRAPVYRWPGGNFVSGYDWKDGIGDPDRRPPRKNPAWRGIEHNDVGIHEFIRLCREIQAEPMIAVNTGLGQVEAARAQIEYANGGPDTPMGRKRAENGDHQPFRVKWWCIGNEMYGEWQLGHMPLDRYVQKHNDFVRAMRAVDPRIEVIAVGSVGPWTEGMLRYSSDYMNLISEHFYVQEKPDLVAHVSLVPDNIRRICEAHRRYREEIPDLKQRNIRIAMDEYNYWYGAYLYGELGTRYFLKDALGIAAGLHEFMRQSDLVFMANYAQTVNVIGAIKTTATAAEFETTGLVLQLYGNHFATVPVALTGALEPLDIQAAVDPDRKRLTVGVVNPTGRSYRIPIQLQGGEPVGSGRVFTISGPSENAFNEPGKPRQVDIFETSLETGAEVLSVSPLSVTLFELPLR